MMRWSAAIGLVLMSVLPVAAADPSLVCFGSEPSWSVTLDTSDTARLSLPDAAPVDYRGAASRIDALRERVWRGQPVGGGPDLVVLLREAECSDGMSDGKHPVVARVSLPDGRFLAGCCRVANAAAPEPAAAAPAPDTAPPPLQGAVWRLTTLRGVDPAALAAIRPGVTARFDGGRLQAFAGCNQLLGTYTVDGDQVTIPALAGTMMACPAPAMTVETAFKKALAGTLRFTVAGDQLTLTPASASEPTLVFVSAPPPRLEGATWEVNGFNNGRHAVVSPLADTTLTLTFENGSVSGQAGCNSFRATYTRDDGHLTIGPPAATRKVCDGKGVMQQEREFLAALESTSTWAVDNRGMLDLHRADGERVLMAHRAER